METGDYAKEAKKRAEKGRPLCSCRWVPTAEGRNGGACYVNTRPAGCPSARPRERRFTGVGADGRTGRPVSPQATGPASLAERAICRRAPEAGAQCPNSGSPGSVRGALRNRRPYRERRDTSALPQMRLSGKWPRRQKQRSIGVQLDYSLGCRRHDGSYVWRGAHPLPRCGSM